MALNLLVVSNLVYLADESNLDCVERRRKSESRKVIRKMSKCKMSKCMAGQLKT